MRATRTSGQQWGELRGFFIGCSAIALIASSSGPAWGAQRSPGGLPSPKAPSHPFVTTSIYEQSDDPSTAYAQGCDAGTSSARGVVILDWGRPAHDHTYGTIDFGGNFDRDGAIVRATEAFAQGYADCLSKGSRAHILLAMGTNNSCSNEDPRCCPRRRHRCRHEPPSFSAAGKYWARRVNDLQSFLNATGLSRRVHASAADDAEPAWDPAFTNTYKFLRGFADTYGYTYAMWDFGSLEPGYWTRWKEYTVANGLKPDVAFPEIYYANNAVQWERLAQWAARHVGHSMKIWGVVSQWARGFDCGFKPHQAYDAMLAQLQSDPPTWQASIPYLTDQPCG
jgi:hypothetical protein